MAEEVKVSSRRMKTRDQIEEGLVFIREEGGTIVSCAAKLRAHGLSYRASIAAAEVEVDEMAAEKALVIATLLWMLGEEGAELPFGPALPLGPSEVLEKTDQDMSF